jgi:tRNA A-37 threonylcarbamoyl transferase component Bud32
VPVVCEACGAQNADIEVKCVACGRALAGTGVHAMIGTVVLGQYEIIDVVGQGGMSVVFRARHRLTEQQVALKILTRELASHVQVKSRFLDEARALAQLDHPNIVHLYNFGEEGGCVALAMQLVQGETLERLILRSGRLDWRLGARVGLDVLDALKYAHGRGIVHRDMKPSNILVRQDTGAATVMDFGIAKMTTSTKLTATGQTMGTVRYMSPEQVRGQPVDLRSDVYSLGATLYEAVVGDTPFDGATHFEIMSKHLNEEPPPPRSRGAPIPAAVEAVILRALEKPRERRFQSAAEMRDALDRLLAAHEPMPASALAALVAAAPAAPAPVAPSAVGASPSADTVVGRNPPPDVPAAPAPRRGVGRTIAWALGSVVVAASAALVWGLRAGGSAAGPDGAVVAAPERGAPKPPVAPRDLDLLPAPFLIPDFVPEVDRQYLGDRLRVIVPAGRDPDAVAAAVVQGRARFLEFVAARTPGASLRAPALNVVVVPSAVICDRRLYEDDRSFADCEVHDSHYRVRERTLYVIDDERLLDISLPSSVALQICLEAGRADQRACHAAFTAFEERLDGAASVGGATVAPRPAPPGRRRSGRATRNAPRRR